MPIRASKGQNGILAARDFLHADLSCRLELVVHGEASIVPQLLGGRDIGIVVTDADCQSVRGGRRMARGELGQLLSSDIALLVRPDMPHEGNSQRLARLQSCFH
jgi:hypothetical protein